MAIRLKQENWSPTTLQRCNACRSASCQACCERSLNMISSFPPSARHWRRNSPICIPSLPDKSRIGCKASRKSVFPPSLRIPIGSTLPVNLWNSFHLIFGLLTNWTPFESPRSHTRIVYAPLCRRSRLPCRAWESPSSVRESPPTTSPSFANSARMAPISAASSRRTASSSCSA